MFCTIYAIFYVFKTLRACNFTKRDVLFTKQYRNRVWVCENKYMNLLIHSTIILEIPKIHIFSQNFAKC